MDLTLSQQEQTALLVKLNNLVDRLCKQSEDGDDNPNDNKVQKGMINQQFNVNTNEPRHTKSKYKNRDAAVSQAYLSRHQFNDLDDVIDENGMCIIIYVNM